MSCHVTYGSCAVQSETLDLVVVTGMELQVAGTGVQVWTMVTLGSLMPAPDLTIHIPGLSHPPTMLLFLLLLLL